MIQNYKLIKIRINAPGFIKIIIDNVVRYHGLPNSIISDWDLLFMSKFWSLLYYFLGIKWKLSMAFHSQTNRQTKK